jgi:hypothetical protein
VIEYRCDACSKPIERKHHYKLWLLSARDLGTDRNLSELDLCERCASAVRDVVGENPPKRESNESGWLT